VNNKGYSVLAQFFGCYFHEDWQLDDRTADSVVKRFLFESSVSEIGKVITGLEGLLEKIVDDKALEATFMWEFGCAYSPAIDGLSDREWLVKTLAVMKEDVRRREVTR
jgi:hypothetical protein